MTSIGNQPAFPCDPSLPAIVPEGMTYRQWLIGMALQGTIALHNGSASYAVRDAVEAADEVIKRLDKENKLDH